MSIKEAAPLVHLSAGAAGGLLGTVLTSPLELLKTRQQSTVSKYSVKSVTSGLGSVRNVPSNGSGITPLFIRQIQAIVASEGGVRSLFKGLTPTVTAMVASKALFFYTNAQLRKLSRNFFNQGTLVHLSSGTAAGVVCALSMNPFWVVKTKLQLDEHKCSRSAAVRAFSGVWKSEGIKGLFRGASASLVGSFEFGVYFMIYEPMKLSEYPISLFPTSMRETSYIPVWTHLAFSSAVSKLIASTVFYPTEVIRTRLREDLLTPDRKRKYKTLVRTCSLIRKEEGARAFYGGYMMHLYKTIPHTIITFMVYEGFIHLALSYQERNIQKY